MIVAILTVSFPNAVCAQGVVTGVVINRTTGEAVVGARVELVGVNVATFSTTLGEFTLDSVADGTHALRITRIGFNAVERELVVPHDTDRPLSIVLVPIAIRLDEIVVTPGRHGVVETQISSEYNITRDEIEATPQVGEDVFRALKRLPGIAADDISTKLNPRGSTDRELLVLLDGMELHEPYHLKDYDGVLGIVDIHAMGGIEVLTGGFPAEYGGKSAGVFRMTSRRAPVTGRRTTLGLSVTNASILSEGGFGAGRGGWLVSGRRGYMDLVLKMTSADEDISPRYGDVFGKVEYALDSKHMVAAHVLHANDAVTFDDGFLTLDTGWRTSYAWATLQSFPVTWLTERLVGWVGRVARRRDGEYIDPGRSAGPEYFNVVDNRTFITFGIRQQIGIEISNRLMLKAGGELERLKADYDYSSISRTLLFPPSGVVALRHDTNQVSLRPGGHKFGAFVAARARPIDALTTELGFRYDHVSHSSDNDWAIRLLTLLELSPTTALRMGWGEYHQPQGVHELQVGDGDLEFHPSDRTRQVALGLNQRLPGNLNIRVEAYRRSIPRQRPKYVNVTRDLDVFPELEGDRLRIDPVNGRTYGVEFLASRELGRRFAWSAHYTLAVAEDEIDGRWVPRTLDQRHTIGLNGIYNPNNRWKLALSWFFHTGWPSTEMTFQVDTLADGSMAFIRTMGELNGLRIPNYHRLDFRVTHTFPIRRGTLTAYFDVFNAYGRRNVRSYNFVPHLAEDGTLEVERRLGGELLPILPAIGFRYEF